jgi:hypothetical protein
MSMVVPRAIFSPVCAVRIVFVDVALKPGYPALQFEAMVDCVGGDGGDVNADLATLMVSSCACFDARLCVNGDQAVFNA